MVSLLQDQANIKFSSSDTLERDQQDLMKTQGDSVSPVQQTVSKLTQFCSLSSEAQALYEISAFLTGIGSFTLEEFKPELFF